MTGDGAGGGGPLGSGATGSGAPGSSAGIGTGTGQNLLHPNTASSSGTSGTGATAAPGPAGGSNTLVGGSSGLTAAHVLAWSSAVQPTVFVANASQWSDGSDFHVQGPGYQLATSASGSADRVGPLAPSAAEQGLTGGSDTVQLSWTGANSGVTATGQGQLGAVSNFYTGSDPSQWRTGVSEYSAVQYANVWNGIDVVYHGTSSGNAEYDFDVTPEARRSRRSGLPSPGPAPASPRRGNWSSPPPTAPNWSKTLRWPTRPRPTGRDRESPVGTNCSPTVPSACP